MKRIKVMIVDDHEVVRMGLRAALELEEDMEVVADAGDAEAALREAEIVRSEVVLMDVRMPGTDGIQACRALREMLPETRVVMLTSYSEDEAVFSSITAGASGYLLKNTPRADLLAAVRSVASGQSLLDPAVTTRVLARLTELSAGVEHREAMPPSTPGSPAPKGEKSSAIGSETTLTIMFTDLVGSTEMVDRLGDRRGRDLLDVHNQIIGRQIAAHGGIEVKSMGDGFMLTFPSARLGVSCAVAVQRELDEYNNEHPESRLDVRMGLSVGEPVRDDKDLIGKSVALAARISAKAEGGQVLASQMVHGLVGSTREFTLVEAGDFELKGISGVHPLYEVLWKRSGPPG